MKNLSVLLVGGELDGQTYTAREDEKVLKIHHSEKKDVITDGKLHRYAGEIPDGRFYIYKQESDGSERFVYAGVE